MKSIHYCEECNRPIVQGVYEFSVLVYGHSLCIGHQAFLTDSDSSPKAVDLYFALKERQIPVALEYFDGRKYIDIALPGKLHIEVNEGELHLSEPGITTIYVPEHLLDDPEIFMITVEELTKTCISILDQSVSYKLARSVTIAQLQ